MTRMYVHNMAHKIKKIHTKMIHMFTVPGAHRYAQQYYYYCPQKLSLKTLEDRDVSIHGAHKIHRGMGFKGYGVFH